ncbi:MAG: hypothetical protein J7K48_09240 [Thermococcus sp.]|nr:hypothetical protein [Thermococcus sp.]
MRIRVGNTKGSKIKVRRVRKKQVVNKDTWIEYMNNHDSITRQEWEVLRQSSRSPRRRKSR